VIDLAKYRCVRDFTCELCQKKGLLQIISKSYARVRHYSHLDPASKKPQFIYHKQSLEHLAKNQSLVNGLVGQSLDQANHDQKLFNYPVEHESKRAGRLAWQGHWLYDQHSNIDHNSKLEIDWSLFNNWIASKYSKSYCNTILCYSRRYSYLLMNGNLRDIDLVPATIRSNLVKSLIVLAKFLGIHQDFKNKLKDYGIKLSRPDAFSSFMRIYNNHSSDLAKWYSEASSVLRENEKLLLRFLIQTGVARARARA